MANSLSDRMTPHPYGDARVHGLNRYNPCEIDPPTPLQMLTRLGLLLMISLAFALAAELVTRLPPH